MGTRSESLHPGDLVELRSPDEIAETLDAEGALDHLPFMPEMLEFYGQRFRVAQRALTACYYGPDSSRGFHADDVVTLDGVRCSGVAHDGCQKACTVFWREAWLQRADRSSATPQADLQKIEALRSRLKVSIRPETYYCQASEILKATGALSRQGRMTRYVRGLRAGNFNVLEMANSIATYLFLRCRRKLFGPFPRGKGKPTPVETLDLQPGEWVEVKSFKSIIDTLDELGRNRGLHFSADMRRWCGRKLRVKGRLDKMIADGTGQMKSFHNTVCLEGSTCGCSYMGGLGMAGCSRCELTYWREIWLRRCGEPDREAAQATAVRASSGGLPQA